MKWFKKKEKTRQNYIRGITVLYGKENRVEVTDDSRVLLILKVLQCNECEGLVFPPTLYHPQGGGNQTTSFPITSDFPKEWNCTCGGLYGEAR